MSPAPTTARVCVACTTPAGPDALFCEECGADLPAAPEAAPVSPDVAAARSAESAVTAPLRAVAAAHASVAAAPARCPDPACGGPVDADGYCTVCGALAPRPRDHMVERPASWVASVSDRGRRHHRNEDAAAVAADTAPGTWAALVVCDGVSSSESSDVASLAAVRAARTVLTRERGSGLASGAALTALADSRVTAAGAAAARAVETATRVEHADSPPSCTFVAALVDGAAVVIGNVGDSRAYWVPDTGDALALTVDDSVAAEEIAAGTPREVAENGPQAHAITRWLGVDSHDQVPTLTHLAVTTPGWLMLCSDGLWNYCSEAVPLGRMVQDAAGTTDADPQAMAATLVDWANQQGGKDNITVALARLTVTTPEGAHA